MERNGKMSELTMSVQAVTGQMREGDFLIDVRTPVEFESSHPTGAQNIPLDQIDSQETLNAFRSSENRDIYLICQSGTRAKMAQQKLKKHCIEGTIVIEGGLNAWKEADLPTLNGKKSISLERQVRIVAGSIVVLGTLIGWGIHPTGFALSAFVGAGLVFAGITDTCGMAILLSKMPWNRRGISPAVRGCSVQSQ